MDKREDGGSLLPASSPSPATPTVEIGIGSTTAFSSSSVAVAEPTSTFFAGVTLTPSSSSSSTSPSDLTCPKTYDLDTIYEGFPWASMPEYIEDISPGECCARCVLKPVCTYWIHMDRSKQTNYVTGYDSSLQNAFQNAVFSSKKPEPTANNIGEGTEIIRYSDVSNNSDRARRNAGLLRKRSIADAALLCTLFSSTTLGYTPSPKMGFISGHVDSHFKNVVPVDPDSPTDPTDLATETPTEIPPSVQIDPPSYRGTDHKLSFHVNLVNRDAFGTVKQFSWKQLQGPVEVSLNDASNIEISQLVAGEYSFQVQVTASVIELTSAVVNVTILPRDNSNPVIVSTMRDIDLEISPAEEGSVLIAAEESYDEEDRGEESAYPLRFHWEIDDSKSPESGVIENPNSFGSVRLSGLRKQGFYFVVLKVMDTDGHEAVSVFTVHYHPAAAPSPVAAAGANQTIIRPVSSAILNGSATVAAAGIRTIVWIADTANPTLATFSKLTATDYEVSNLTLPGLYMFKIVVTDVQNYTSTAATFVRVVEDLPPVANAGDDQTVSNLAALILLNASKSYDDLSSSSQLRYQWQKLPESPAAGSLIDSNTATAKVVGFIAGKYVFRVTVTDQTGKEGVDDVVVTVLSDDQAGYMLELRLDTDISLFSTSQEESVKAKLAELYGTTVEWIVVDSVREGSVIMTFHVVNSTSQLPIPALSAVSFYRKLLQSGKLTVGFPVLSINTFICDNTCSGHGKCDALTKQCVCDPYWVENVFETMVLNGDSNCEWSIVYVILVSGIVFLVLLFLGWLLCWYCYTRRCRGGKRRQTILDRRSKGDSYDKVELMPRGQMMEKLMDEDEEGDEYDEEEDIFDARYLTDNKRPSSKSPQVRMLRLHSSSSNGSNGSNGSSTPVKSPTKKASSLLLATDEEDDKPFVNELAASKQTKKPASSSGGSGLLSKFKKSSSDATNGGSSSSGKSGKVSGSSFMGSSGKGGAKTKGDAAKLTGEASWEDLDLEL